MIDKTSTKAECWANASETLKRYREKLLEAVKRGDTFINLIRILEHDREMVLEAVRANGYAFQFASYELKNDREFILAAVRQNASALGWVSEEMQIDMVQGWAKCMEQELKND